MAGFILPIISGISALAGLFGGNKTSGTSTTNSSSTPVYGPGQQQLLNTLLSQYQSSVDPATLAQFGNSYTSAGLQNIQQSAGTASQSLQDVLAARGLSRTGAGAAITAGNEYSSGENIANFLNQAPITLANYKNALLSNAGGFLSSLPVGSTTSSTTNQTGTVGPISQIAGGITSGASTLAGLYGQQAAQQSLTNILNSLGMGSNSNIATPATIANSPNGSYNVPQQTTPSTTGTTSTAANNADDPFADEDAP